MSHRGIGFGRTRGAQERSPDESQPLLSCRNVSKRFGALAAVDSLDLDVRAGEVLGVGGPNGAGKTTLIDVISGLLPVSGGEILLAGDDIVGLTPERICRRGIARTFQLNAGFDTLTVRENVMVGAAFGRRELGPQGLRIGRAVHRWADEAIELVGLADKAAYVVGALPILDRKLLMLAGALATEPRLLLLDEPVGGLSPGEIDEVVGIVSRVLELGVTIILIEHVMRFLLRLSTRAVIMHHGEKIYDGSPTGLVRDERVIDVYLGEGTAGRLQNVFKRTDADGSPASAR